jgi:hypothetical protein
MVDHRGSMYGVTPTADGTGKPAAQQELFQMSGDGQFKTIVNISTNSSCTISQGGAQGTIISRSVSVVGYDLAASSLYLRIWDVNETHLVYPQNGFFFVCQNGSLLIANSNGTLIPNEQDTILGRTSIVKITVPGS